jgi:hypothetical protein
MSRPDVDDPRWAWKEYADELQAENAKLQEKLDAALNSLSIADQYIQVSLGQSAMAYDGWTNYVKDFRERQQ